MRQLQLLVLFALAISILTAVYVVKMSKDITPVVAKMKQLESFFVGFAKPEQSSSGPVQLSVPKANTAEQGGDAFQQGLSAFAELLHRQNANCPTTGTAPDGTPVPDGLLTAEAANEPKLDRMINPGQTVRDCEALMESVRRIRAAGTIEAESANAGPVIGS